MKVDRSKPSEVTVTIDGKVYKTDVYPELSTGGAMSWSTDFSKLPKEGRVIVQGKPGREKVNCKVELYIYDVNTIIDNIDYWVAWHPGPEPFVAPKPEQIKRIGFRWRIGPLFNFVNADDIIRPIEQRTREIVAWEQKYGDDK